jgi:formylmethanofuran dehydrogenase subunit E
MEKVRSYTLDQYCEAVAGFHGTLAPGMIVGWFMIDLARRQLPPGTLFDVICETVQCLPDAVQMLTPCSVGNQWMKVIDVGRFAMTLYDKDTGVGVRVHLDSAKLDGWPAIKEWFLKLKPKAQQDRQQLQEELKKAGAGILTLERITVTPEFVAPRPGKQLSLCPVCNEVYRSADGAICPACSQARLPYSCGNEVGRKVIDLLAGGCSSHPVETPLRETKRR